VVNLFRNINSLLVITFTELWGEAPWKFRRLYEGCTRLC